MWNTVVHNFDNSLGSPSVLNVSQAGPSPHNGSFGSIVAMPDSVMGPAEAMVAFNFRKSTSTPGHLKMAQRLDTAGMAVAWPARTFVSQSGGADVTGVSHSRQPPTMGWSRDNQIVGYTYEEDYNSNGGVDNDLFFIAVDPVTGNTVGAPIHLNANAPEFGGRPKVEWDGKEFLVMWLDDRFGSASRLLRLTKIAVTGVGGGASISVIGSGDVPYWHKGIDTLPRAGGSIVGHNGIHTITYSRNEPVGRRDVWMCIEPQY